MALSGANNGGSSVGGSYIRLEWSASQNWGANTSTITARLLLVLQGGTSISATEVGDINIDGAVFGYSRGSTGRGPNGTHQLHAATHTIGHNGDGTRYFGIGGWFRSGWTGFGQINVGMNGWTLDTIPRYANVTAWSLPTVTEKSITVNVNTDSVADLVDYSLNGGGWVRGYTGNFTGVNFVIGGLQPATAYSVKVRVRRQASGLYSETGLRSATTNAVTITSATVPQATDTSLSVTAVTSHLSDLIQYRQQGTTPWIDGFAGDFTTANFIIGGLAANQSYTFELRARHKDTGAWTPTRNITGATGDPQPLQATLLAPINAQGVDNITPTLSWRYNATSPDAQTAFQVVVRRESTGAIVYDSGKVSSAATQHQVPSGISFNVAYQWQVRTWSGTDIQGPYSDTALFKTSQKPTVTITAPSTSSVVPTSSPTIVWTYSDPEGTAQRGYRVVVKQISAPGQADGTVVIDQQNATSAANSYSLPVDALTNGARYIAEVYATDTDGVTGKSAISEFRVEFVAPKPPEVDVELSEDVMFTRVTVTSNKPDDDAYEADQFRIYRRELGQTAWNEIGRVSPTFADIQSFDSATGFTATSTSGGGVTVVGESDNAKQGTKSIGITRSVAGETLVTKVSGIGSLEGYDKVRVWVRAVDVTKITSIRFRFGQNATNYFQFQINKAQLASGVWKSFEVPINSLTTSGAPNISNIAWTGVVLVTSGAVAGGELLVDGLRGVGMTGDTFIYDYKLANNKTYEYAATAFNNDSALESEKTTASAPVAIVYDEWRNTYLIPVYSQGEALVAFMEGTRIPSWTTQTDTAYYTTANGRYPVVYTRGGQKYRRGTIAITFIDEKFGGPGLEAEAQLREIMNYKPIMLRTWWGEILYISFDGNPTTTRRKGVAWESTLNFTEINPE